MPLTGGTYFVTVAKLFPKTEAKLSAASGRNCSEKGVRPSLVPVGMGKQSSQSQMEALPVVGVKLTILAKASHPSAIRSRSLTAEVHEKTFLHTFRRAR